MKELDTVSAAYTKEEVLADGESNTSYFTFSLAEDSWVIFKGNYSLMNHDGCQTHVSVYSDSSFSNMKFEYGWGYWEEKKEYTAFLSKGTYYGMLYNQQANGDTFEGNVNVIAAAIPVSKVLGVTQKVSSNKNSVTVVFPNALGSYCKSMQYRPGEVSIANVSNPKYWKQKNFFDEWEDGDSKVKVLEADGNNNYKFQVNANGSYTIRVEDIDGNCYSKIIKIKGIDTTKPKVTGVANKKTYKKTVTIKFSDKQSGIKSATLNNKKIKSGKRVSKSGSYTLIVKDKAGNTTKIKFKIKK